MTAYCEANWWVWSLTVLVMVQTMDNMLLYEFDAIIRTCSLKEQCIYSKYLPGYVSNHGVVLKYATIYRHLTLPTSFLQDNCSLMVGVQIL